MPHQHHQHHPRQFGGVFMSFGNDDGDDGDGNESVVFITLSPTFDGPVGGFSTQNGGGQGVGNPVQQTRIKTTTKSTAKATSTSVTGSQSSTTPTSSASVSSSTPTSSVLPSAVSSLPSSTPAATPSPNPEPSGMSSGAKAGLAVGIIALVGLIAAGLFVFARKRRQSKGVGLAGDREKFTGNVGASPNLPPMRTASGNPAAQRFNDHPFNQHPPGTMANQATYHNMSNLAGSATAAGAVDTIAAGSRNYSAENGRHPRLTAATYNTSSNPFSDPMDPFSNPSEPSRPSTSTTGATVNVPEQLRVAAPSPESTAQRQMTPENTAVAGGVVAAPGAALADGATAVTEMRRNLNDGPFARSGPNQAPATDLPPPSPAGSFDSVSVTSTAAAAMANGTASGPPNNVHRVQLDFSPNMEDELELRAGQLIRLMHEYDDGWALCVRPDGSQQGVAPRSCLSARPVRPRARGGPHGSGPRVHPGPPPSGRPISPAGGRMSPGLVYGPLTGGPQRSGPPTSNRPSSPSAGQQTTHPQDNSASLIRFPATPRSGSPGPGGRPAPVRSMSPGPYGPGGMDRPRTPENQRKRSNSAGGAIGRFYASNTKPSALSSELQPGSQSPKQVELRPQSPAAITPKPPPSLGPVGRKPVPGQHQ